MRAYDIVPCRLATSSRLTKRTCPANDDSGIVVLFSNVTLRDGVYSDGPVHGTDCATAPTARENKSELRAMSTSAANNFNFNVILSNTTATA